jgi:two-component system, cell cycle response regulator
MKLLYKHKSSVKTRLAIAIGSMFVPLLLLAGGTLFYLEKGINTFEKTENQALEELFPLAHLESLIVDTSNPVKDYMINGDYKSRLRFIHTSQEVDRTFATILAVNSKLPEQKILLQSSRKKWQQTLAMGETVFTYPNPANKPRAKQAAETFYDRNSQTVSSLYQLYKLLAHLQIAENLNQAEHAKQQVRLIVAVAFLLGAGVAAVTSTVVVRSIVKPLSELEKGVARLGDGDFSYRILLSNQAIAESNQSDELGQLALAFNLMIQKLEQSQTALKNLAILDELTGVYNRREFNLQLKNELERSGRYNNCFTVLLLDIDHFKQLNDTYGHQAGDEALRQVAALFKQEFRELDRVARYGGEEFIVILPETSGASAYAVAERIRQLISTYALPFNGKTINMTISGGLATFPKDGETQEALIAAADQALYFAKRSGRNQIIIYSSLSVEKIS